MSDTARNPPSHAALDYHHTSSHVPGKLGGHGLDWGSQPTLYKEYRTLPGIEARILPEPEGFASLGLDLVLEGRVQTPPLEPADMAGALSRVLAQACGITSVSRHGRGDFHYRAAASAGALYPVECYVALSRSAPLPDGSANLSRRPHHYHPLEHALLDLGVAPLALEQALQACGMAQDSGCIAAFFLTGIWYRSAWKYRERAYRYVLLDAGHVLENLLLALRAEGLSATVRYDFQDTALNQMLCLDPDREACLAVVFVRGNTTSQENNAVSAAAEPASETRGDACATLAALSRTASREVSFPAINTVHAAGDRHGPPPDDDNNRKSAIDTSAVPGLSKDLVFAPLPEAGATQPMPPLHQCIFGRRSRRNHVPQPLEWSALGNALRLLLRPDPPGCNPDRPETAPHVALALHKVTGAGDPGSHGLYLLRCEAGNVLEWAPLRGRSVQEKLAAICLGQAWLQHANAMFLFLADIGTLEALHGARGYRQVMLEAGRLGERVYLLATALGLGACGIGAFFDAPAAELMGLGRDVHLLHLTAMGRVRG